MLRHRVWEISCACADCFPAEKRAGEGRTVRTESTEILRVSKIDKTRSVLQWLAKAHLQDASFGIRTTDLSDRCPVTGRMVYIVP